MDILHILNGSITASPSDVVKNKIIYSSLPSCENSSNNSWYINMGDGNVNNNNNKNNSNNVRAVAALSNEEKIGWIRAYKDCCRHKASSKECVLYRTHYKDLWSLAYEVKFGLYEPSISSCFIVTRPKYREIFAANFRDRIVQHWIMLRIRGFLEERFVKQGNVSFNCRKGFGTFKAISELKKKIEKVSHNYTRKAYIGKFDLKAFFMSIDKTILLRLLIPFIKERYKEEDKETLIRVITVIIKHCPQNKCIRKSPIQMWNLLSKDKSLFNANPNIGVAIGNISSQELANFFMSFFDDYMIWLCSKAEAEYLRFVDDFSIVCADKEFIINIKRKAQFWLSQNLNLTLHHDKFYLQEVTKGVKFVGAVIKPGRVYSSNITVGNLYNKVKQAEWLSRKVVVGFNERTLKELTILLNSINSYLGFLVHNNTYAIRTKLFCSQRFFWKCYYIQGKFSVVKIRDNYNYHKYLVNQVRNELELYKQSV